MSSEIEVLPGIKLGKEQAEGFYAWITSTSANVLLDYFSQEAQMHHDRANVEIDHDVQYEYHVLESQKQLAKENIYNALLQIPEMVADAIGLKK